MDEDDASELDDTITVPRLPSVIPVPPLASDLEDTRVPGGKPKGAPFFDHAPEPPHDTAPISRPAALFYRFRLGEMIVWLDVEAYVGRRPTSPRIFAGRMPRLIRVPSPAHEVSGTHLEVRQLGASVVVTDMRTTNGSIVYPPGAPPRKLRQGESVVAPAGTLVDIGDGNVLEVLPLERLVQSEDPTSADERGRE